MFHGEHYLLKIFGKEEPKSLSTAFWAPENPLKQ